VGQILLVQAGDGAAVNPVFERGIALFHALAGVAPADRIDHPNFCVSAFPRLTGPGARLLRDGPRFAAAAGTWAGDAAGGDPLAALSQPLGTLPRAGLDRADGLYFVAAGDGEAIACATDLVGRLHAYHAEVDGCAVVSTSALVVAALARAPLDPLACQELLGCGNVYERRSLFRGVTKLEPATRFELRGGRLAATERTWDVRSLFPGGMTEGLGTAPALADALVAAVERTLAGFSRPIIDLTGGFDSRAVVAAALATGRPFECVVNGRDDDPDAVSAQRIAAKLGLKLVRLRPGLDYGLRSLGAIERAVALTDGEHDAVEYSAVLEIHERLARQGDLTVNGTAGELCRGYWWDLVGPHPGSRVPLDFAKVARRFVHDDWADRILASPAAPRLAGHFAEVVARAVAGLDGLPNTVRIDQVYLGLRMHRWAGRLASATDRIWPCATPFLFRRPLEIALTAPVAARAHDRMMRRLIEHLSPALASLPMAGGYPAAQLRPSNLPRFLPLLAKNVSKAVRRVRRSLGRPARPRPDPTARPASADLWAQEDVRALLRPASMKTAHLYDPAALAAFLAESESPGFASDSKLGRVLTLELVAQALDRVRAV
jgi:asparagine synthetase B (glutamine-hydrolysing)